MRCFMVDARVKRQGKHVGKREYFKQLADAQTRAKQLEVERTNDGIAALGISAAVKLQAAAAVRKLAVYGATIDDAVAHYVAFRQIEAARLTGPTVSDAVERYLAARRSDHQRGLLSRLSLYEIEGRAKKLAAAFNGARLTELDQSTMEKWLTDYPAGVRTKTNVRLRLSHFFNWCRDEGLIATNPVERVRFKAPESEIHVLNVEQAEALLRAAEVVGGDAVAYTALGLFAGMRVGEISQLRWEHINLEARELHVLAETTKVRRQRIVEMNEALVACLSTVGSRDGLVIQPNFRKRWEKVVEASKVTLTTNVLRHTGISMALAASSQRERVAEQCGTSVDVIARFYRRPISRAEAEKFFALRLGATKLALSCAEL